MRVALAQYDFKVGDLERNTARIVSLIAQARDQHAADVVVFPELAITGYPPEDLLLRPAFIPAAEACVERVAQATAGIDVIVGHPLRRGSASYNSVTWLRDGRALGDYQKQLLPNYAVFDEKRYFDAGHGALVHEIGGVRCGVMICEDSWGAEPAQAAARAGAELLLIPNASPFHRNKAAMRNRALKSRARESGCAIAYLNLVGGQDELVFDGASLLVAASGESISPPARSFEEHLLIADYDRAKGEWRRQHWPEEVDTPLGQIYRAIVCGTRDYVRKNGFDRVLLGLSGGIDSALTLAVAVDAFGADHVHAVMLPSQYTSALSLELAEQQCAAAHVRLSTIPIQPSVDQLEQALAAEFTGLPTDVTEENLQSRCRGALLMALSNKQGSLLLTTGNKSEYAVGYATIYGDMCGAFAPLKDCPKTLVYELAAWRNRDQEIIPQAVIDRPPSAELRHDQTDQDSLPPYADLDEMLRLYVEQDLSIAEIVARGFAEETVRHVVRLVHINEYKRRQSAPGVRITPRAFGRDRRYPMTSAWDR